MPSVNLRWIAKLLHINTWRNFNRIVTQKILWFGASDKFKIWLLNFQQMEVPVEVHKVIKCANSTVFYSSGGGLDDILVLTLMTLIDLHVDDLNCF